MLCICFVVFYIYVCVFCFCFLLIIYIIYYICECVYYVYNVYVSCICSCFICGSVFYYDKLCNICIFTEHSSPDKIIAKHVSFTLHILERALLTICHKTNFWWFICHYNILLILIELHQGSIPDF